MYLMAFVDGIQHERLCKSIAKSKLSLFDELLDRYDKYVVVKDSKLLIKNCYQSKSLKEEK